MKHGWRSLQRANEFRNEDQLVRAAVKMTGQDETSVREMLDQEASACEYWVNDLYQVSKRELRDPDDRLFAYHLCIRRRDGRVIFRDWRHFQTIKNELVGEECEGFELYPAESRLSDSANKYHLFVFADPTFRIPFGMTERDVVDDNGERRPGLRQRKLA